MRKKYGIKSIRGINIQNSIYLNGCLITSLKDLARFQEKEIELKKAMRKKFPVDNLLAITSLQNWCQQAHLLIAIERKNERGKNELQSDRND